MRQPTNLDNLHFVQAMLRELRQFTQADGEHLLTYLIDMAYLQASDRVRSAWAEQNDTTAEAMSPPRK
ncbi:hypothetical protein FJW07_30700 [Mesorhizobium sp. B3-1-9]|uniref:hypothetical protein n=1 Tax=Mesorhizobium sp. B3-1-9 TaxID=2589892 RepID=UPI0011298B20|nr:hypothetical protein [Mesorhizobium sp. B3-1-9]TPI28796.1 hypothetical protein FJW07_30700 [Mesorhizobium sp. B3-1-9]